MRSTVTICLLAALLAAVPVAAAGQDQPQTQPRFRIGIYFEGSVLNDKNLTEFFGHSQRNLPGFEASVHTLYNIDVWASYRIYTDKTKTTFYGKEDKFKLSQASLGLVYRPIVWRVLEPFVGAGFEIYSYSEKIEGDALPATSGNAFGVHVQGGTYVKILKNLDGKVFLRLNSVKKTLPEALPDGTTKLDLGGKEFGVGLVFKF
jgi:opacity protein-like surface antigen